MTYYANGDSNGNIISYYSDEFNYPGGIPSSAIVITNQQWQDSINNPGKYAVRNGSLVILPGPTASQQLESAQQAQQAELQGAYTQTLLGGFSVSIGNGTHVMGGSTDDLTHLNATQLSIEKGFLTFPIYYADINGFPIQLSEQSDLDLIEETASKFFISQHQQILNLKAQVQAAADVNTVNEIVWIPATY